MSVTFYPADVGNEHKTLGLELDVSSFNASLIFTMLAIQGKTEHGTLGSLDREGCIKALNTLSEFIQENHEVLNSLGMYNEQYVRYTTTLSRILGFCVGKGCEFRWA